MSVDEIIEEFRSLQNRFTRHGATDTEPDHLAQAYLACALGLAEPEPFLPVTWEDWELYEGEGADEAARALTRGLRDAEEKLKLLLAHDPRGTFTRLRARLWRVSR